MPPTYASSDQFRSLQTASMDVFTDLVQIAVTVAVKVAVGPPSHSGDGSGLQVRRSRLEIFFLRRDPFCQRFTIYISRGAA